MKMKTSLRLLCVTLTVILLCASLPLSAYAETIAEARALSQAESRAVKQISVSTFDELKEALEADDHAVITLENDITKDIRPKVFLSEWAAEYYDYNPYEDFDEGEYSEDYSDTGYVTSEDDY